MRNNINNIIPVILAGGSGTRLWPLSRKHYPKQYLSLMGDNTMLQETILRLKGLFDLRDLIIICNVEHRFLVADQCKKININNPIIILEPIGRNTAPAIAAAAFFSMNIKNNSQLLVLSADHLIQDIDSFHDSICVASKHAQDNKLVTFGVVPSHPNTDYGYIKSSKININGAYKVEKFVEKPDLETAQFYYKQGDYLWNSGMFIFKANIYIDELERYAPEINKAVEVSVKKATYDLDFIRLEKKSFELSPSNSIDFALIEKSVNTMVVPLDADWSDVGSWDALYEVGLKDSKGNVIHGDVIVEDTINSYINAKHHIVAIIGLQDVVVVDTPNATLISSRAKVHDVKKIVERLQVEDRDEEIINRKVFRPWGWYDLIEVGLNFQVKRLHVNPGEKLSLQMHQKRAEHWVVVNGTATVTNGDEIHILIQGQSTFIPKGVKHSLENNTSEDLEIIEVQSGEYLGEDDIVRFEDNYGRLKD